MQTDNDVQICGTFHTRAELHGSLCDIKNAMKILPNIKCASTGTRIRYLIYENENKNVSEAVLELAPKEISFMFPLTEPNIYEYKHNLLRFMSILSYLKDLYTISMGDMYCYVIEALRHDSYAMAPEVGRAANQPNERIEALNDVNVSLSHELTLKNEHIRKMNRHLTAYESFSKEIIQKLSLRHDSSSNASKVLISAGINESLASEILSLISDGGMSKKSGVGIG